MWRQKIDWKRTQVSVIHECMSTSDAALVYTGKPHPQLLELLVCPLTKTRLVYDEHAQELISQTAQLAYPIRDGIPIMLPQEARKLAQAD